MRICASADGETSWRAARRRSSHCRLSPLPARSRRRRISNAALAAREGPIIPLIAETGGVNAMVVDSSALPEQVVDDVVVSAFQSAGQRCSAQRILFVDEGCAPRVLQLIAGALAELKVGDPADPDTDVGPISRAAHVPLAHHTKAAQVREADRRRPLHGLPGRPFHPPIAFQCRSDALPYIEISADT